MEAGHGAPSLSQQDVAPSDSQRADGRRSRTGSGVRRSSQSISDRRTPRPVGRTIAYPASAFRSPASIFSAASSCMPGITCEYVSSVMPIEARPSLFRRFSMISFDTDVAEAAAARQPEPGRLRLRLRPKAEHDLRPRGLDDGQRAFVVQPFSDAASVACASESLLTPGRAATRRAAVAGDAVTALAARLSRGRARSPERAGSRGRQEC